jgi:hypothetical protein
MEDVVLSIEGRSFLSKTTCPVCNNILSRLISKTKTIHPHSNITTELRECLSCTHWWNTPLPTQETLDYYYTSGSEYVVPKNYTTSIQETPYEDAVLWENILLDITRYSKKLKEGSKFNYLEIGVGSGGLFSFFKKRAILAYGVEPGEWVRNPSENIVTNINNLPKGVLFDVIVAHDVLEHITNPIEMLATISLHTEQGGIIHCTFPNKDSLKAKIQKASWHMIRPFGHVHYFSKKSTKKMFELSGWHVLKIKNCRISERGGFDVIKSFDTSSPRVIYRLVKSLILGQLILGKDQWTVIAVKK